MKKGSYQQEILLMATTSFSKRQWSKIDSADNDKLSGTEQLEEVCWNGLLNEMLPEIALKSESGKNLYLWQIRNGKSFLQIELCEFPQGIQKVYSIDPQFFLTSTILN
jgi:hypothetical protein